MKWNESKRGRSTLLGVAVLSLAAAFSSAAVAAETSVHADPFCSSGGVCQHEVTDASVGLPALQSGPELDPIVKTTRGRVATMTQHNAQKYCESLGKRLPTVKELALVMNPQGVHEAPVETLRLQPVFKQDATVDFYYDERTYARPQGPAGNYWFWTSSVYPDHAEHAYGFHGFYGVISFDRRDVKAYCAVRCVSR